MTWHFLGPSPERQNKAVQPWVNGTSAAKKFPVKTLGHVVLCVFWLLAAAIEIEGEKKPACVAELVFRFYGA